MDVHIGKATILILRVAISDVTREICCTKPLVSLPPSLWIFIANLNDELMTMFWIGNSICIPYVDVYGWRSS